MTETNTQSTQKVSWRIVAGIISVGIILLILLLLDLQFKGLAWQFFWSQTGEEDTIGQLNGMVSLGGNVLRQQPNTLPLVPIDNATNIPFGVNTFLQKEVEEPKMREMLRMIKAAGFEWLRQEFTWEDLEVDGRGQFTDSRNDFDEDGEPETIDAWIKYDRLVDLVEEYDLKLIVRLSNPPAWSRSDPNIGELAPPDDLQDFVNYAVAVAERYKGRITHYQIWNEPNIYPEWGNQFVDPARYTEMLCRTYDALKEVDPNIVVASGAIAPTISLDGYQGYQDVIFLQNMYDHGAGECFDVLSAQGYGLFSGPTDQRFRLTNVNFARHVYYRDLMVANGDAHKPIWLSEVAWNPVLDAQRPMEEIADFMRFGAVTNEQAARYAPLAYQRAQEDWSWVGMVTYWFFTRHTDTESDQSFFYFRMVEPDYFPDKPTFTPLPIYNTLSEYLNEQLENPVLYRGVHQAESWQITAEDSQLVEIEEAQFDEAVETLTAEFTASGTDVLVRWQDNGDGVAVLIDGEPSKTILSGAGWSQATIHSTQSTETHTIRLAAFAPFQLDSITVVDNTWRNAARVTIPIVAVGLAVFGILGMSLWRRLRG